MVPLNTMIGKVDRGNPSLGLIFRSYETDISSQRNRMEYVDISSLLKSVSLSGILCLSSLKVLSEQGPM